MSNVNPIERLPVVFSTTWRISLGGITSVSNIIVINAKLMFGANVDTVIVASLRKRL